MIISDTLSHEYDCTCVTIAIGKYEGSVYKDASGRVWAESDGQRWEVDGYTEEEKSPRDPDPGHWGWELDRQRYEESEDRYGYDVGGW